ncbi:MAG: hypothetical protein LBS77_04765 [Desulfovibrio sp.]|nr:hypothetical protein [Desulfovibrio sp.]
MPQMTTYDIHRDNHLVAWPTPPYEDLENLFCRLRDIPGVYCPASSRL